MEIDLIDNNTQRVFHKPSILPEYDELVDLCFQPKVNTWQLFGFVFTMINSLGGKASSDGGELAREVLSKELSFGNLSKLKGVTCAEYLDALKGVISSSTSESEGDLAKALAEEFRAVVAPYSSCKL